MDFPCQRVEDITKVTQNNYVMQSGQGVTQLITRVLYQTIDTIEEVPGHKIDANAQPEQGNAFYKHYIHYNIRQQDPELMLSPQWHTKSIGHYHFQYLHDACQYNNIRYRKKRPEKVATIEFFNEIVLHINQTAHLETFREFYNYIQMVRNKIKLSGI